jgi:thymidine kinase
MQRLVVPVGHIEVICGPMFSGKSETLIGRLRRCTIARQTVQVFKPAVDDRYALEKIVSHSALFLEAQLATTSSSLAESVLPETQVVGIDEVQFFDADIVSVIERLADAGKRVVVAGLDMDYRGQPFETIALLLPRAEYVTKMLAVCSRCGGPAGRSQRLIPVSERVVIGAQDTYEARCRRCHEPRPEATSGELFA